MFNDIGALELLTLVVLAVLVFGPEKLPKVIQDVTRTIRKIREFSDSAKEDIRSELGPQFKDFEFEDLNPKTFVRKQLMDGNDDLGLKEIRESFDLRKEMAEVTDAVNGRESAPPPLSPVPPPRPTCSRSPRPTTPTRPRRTSSRSPRSPRRTTGRPSTPTRPETRQSRLVRTVWLFSICPVACLPMPTGGGPLRISERSRRRPGRWRRRVG